MAHHDGRLFSLLQGLQRVSKVWKYLACTCCYASSYYQTMAFSWLGARLYWPNLSPIFQGTPIYVGCYGLLYQVDRASAFEEYDT
jgi:hypothetical protein